MSAQGTRQGRTQGRRPPPLARVSRDSGLPLSFAQQRLWFIEQLAPGGFAYNVPLFARLEGLLDVAALERSLAELIRRHEALRTTFAQVNGRPVQRIAPELPFSLPVEELEGVEEREQAVRRLAEEEARRPFDLEKGPLVRARLLRVAPDEHVLLLTLHHISCDGWSLGVMERELSALYQAFHEGKVPALPALPVQYADYAKWQREWLTEEVLEAQLAWWRPRLAGAPPVLELPTDRPRPPVQTFRGSLLQVPLPPGLSEAVRELSRREGVTPFMTLLAAWYALLARYSGQTDLVVGSPIAGRNRREVEGLIGFFANSLPLRVDVSGEVSFRELLVRVRGASLDASAHQDVPLEKLVEALQPVRDLSRTALFQVVFALENAPFSSMRLPGVSVGQLEFEPGTARFDLILFMRETAKGLVGVWEYSTELFDRATVERMAAHYVRLLEGAVARPEQRVSALPLLSEAERHQLLVEWNATRAEYPRDTCIHEWVAAQARVRPEALALAGKGRRLTYRALEERANQLAHHLRALGVGPEVVASVCVERSVDYLVGALGILKAGGAYLPMDSAYPAQWQRYVVEDSRSRVVVTQCSLAGRFVDAGVPVVCLDAEAVLEARPAHAPESGVEAENLAYVIYTSGSTGRPKGVGVTHRSLANLVEWYQREYEVTPEDRVSLVAGLAFDASVFEVWPNLAGGASVHLPEEEARVEPGRLLRWMAEERLTLGFMPTPMAEAALEEPWPEGMVLRALQIGGDMLHRRPGRELKTRVMNLYGPTENTVATTSSQVEVEGVEGVLPHIGRPISNVRVYVLDERLEPVPVGVWGELYLGGESLARGYLGRAELTAESFLPNPFSTEPGARLYRTGDIVRYLPEGNLEFRGRRGTQVKVRGFRIELGEIEAVLAGHPAVREGVVVAREDSPGSKRLVAYYVAQARVPPVSELREYLKEKLPEYMVPSAFVRLEALPLTPNGKVDRKALPAPRLEGEEQEAYVAPRTAMEELVAGIWAPLLKRQRVGANDHFFELGGHSLLVTQAVSRLREALRMELPVRVLFEAPTVAGLAARLESMPGGTEGLQAPPLVPMPRDGAPPLSFAQQRLWFLEQFEPGGFSYNVPFFARLKGRLDVAVLERSLREIVRRHEALRTTFMEVEGQPVQRISPELLLLVPKESLEALPEAERAGAVERLAEEEARRPFDLEKGPLVRARLLRVAPDEHVLLLMMHHIVCDGWSMGILVRELESLYQSFSRGGDPSLTAQPVQYADYAKWQREWLKGGVLEEQLAWWKQRLAGAPLVLELPTDRPRPPVRSSRGALLRGALPPGLSGMLQELSRQEGVTPFMTLLAAFQALLVRYSGQTDLVVGTPISGRNRREVEGLIGFFVNTLALRVQAPGEVSFRELLGRVREACLGVYAHQDLPFDQLVDALQPVRDPSRAPLFQVVFALQESLPTLELPGLSLASLDIDPGMAKFDLSLFVRESTEGWVSFWEYSTDLFDEATVARMAGYYTRLLESALAHPERKLAELSLLAEEERHRLLVEWNQTRTEYPREACVHGLFEEHVACRPDAVAVEYEGETLTYAELNRRANQVARYLRRLGVVEGTRVGLCAGRSLELVAAMLGILKSGGAYVPLDLGYPRERLAFMVEDTAVPVVLVQPELLSRLPPVRAKMVMLERSWESFSLERGEDLGERASPEAPAYVMYTSGSTGRPKGVCIPHRGIVRLVRDTHYVRLTEEERVAQVCNTAFDGSTFELWSALLNGGCLVGVPREVALSPSALAGFLREKRISVTFLPTALFNQVAAECPDAFRTVKYVLFGGEAADAESLRKVLAHGAPRHLVNGYGPTENTTFSTTFEVKEVPEGAASVPIGRPLENSEAYVLDERMQPVPVGVMGELYVGGDGLALGYLNRPELTVEKFVTHPFSTEPGAKLYRTGDLVRFLPDGNLEYLGRRDAQVKVRGFRIELGEIEAALAKHPGVGEVVVAARDEGLGGKQLVAYVVPREGHEVEAGGLRAFLKETLPEYMVPAAFVRLERLPLTPNGKVDRKALPAPEAEGTEREGYVAPRTELERVVADVWASLLKQQRVGARDNFFELGGHSLLAARVATRLREKLRMEFSVRVLFEAPTVAELAARLESMTGGKQGPAVPPLVPVPRDGELPLSFAQQRMWFLEQFEPGGYAYNVPMATRLRGQLEVAALERSLEAVVRRHEVLRTTFMEVNGRPVPRIASELVLTTRVESLESLPEGARAEAARQLAEEEARRPFDLERGPLVRAKLLRVAPDEHVLLLVMHHIVCDIVSLGVLLRELAVLYRAFSRGEEPSLPELPVQYADFARWQREWLKDEVLEEQLAWWKQQLAGAPPTLELPTDRPRPPVQTFRGAHLAVPLSSGLSTAVQELGRQEGVTPFMTLLAAFQSLLARYSGQTDLVVGSPIVGRNRREVEGLVGCFLNTLAFRVDASGDVSFRELLGRVRETSLGAFAHQDLPFEQLVDALQPVRDLSRSPLFQVMFVHQLAPPSLELTGLSASELSFAPGMAKFDLTLFVRELGDGLVSIWEYNTDLFDEATVTRMAAHYARLLEGAVANPEQRVSALPLLDEEERRRVLVEFNDTAALYAPANGVHELFEAWVDRTPEAVAVSFGEERLTYEALNRKANRLAHHLRTLGVGPDVPMGLCVRRSLELAVGVLGILKAGGAYVPLDPAYPPERLALMLEASRAPVLLTQRALKDTLPASEARRLYLDAEESDFARESEANPERVSGPKALAYVIYTSGSTGVPKGVAMSHGPLLNLIGWQVERSAVKAKTLQFSALSFDVSFQELFSTWAAGGELVLIPEELRLEARALLELMDSREVERLFLPFVALQNLAEVAEREGLAPRKLKEVITAGEQLRVTPALRAWMKRLGGVLENQYGPTETHVATAYRLEGEPEQWPDLPCIGRPIANTSVHLLDGNGEPVPVGVPGELYIGGAAVARGYLHRPELTKERFLEDRVGGVPGGRLYRTGDYARYLPDGRIEFLGRRDAQVKVRGFRIELAEVEAVLAKHPSVRDCIVEARDAASGQKRLVAYVVGKDGQVPVTGELRSFLKERLPEYMVPSAFMSLEAFPLTPSGKVDRKALPAPDSTRQEPSQSFVGPRTALELQVTRIWEELLGIQPIGVHDNFFELGGNSLLAIRLLSRIRASMGRNLPVAALFQNATVEHLAGLLRKEAGPWSPLVELRGGGGKRPFFCVHAVGGTVLGYVELARLLGPEQPFYGLQSRGLDGEQEPCESVEEMAALYLEAIRKVQPRGPYLLGGWSMGGTIALEMARQLQQQGEQVDLLALIDSYDLAPAMARVPPEQQEASRLAARFHGELPLPEEGRQSSRALQRVLEKNLLAAWKYVPQPYTGSLTLFEASESALREQGGGRFAATREEVHPLQGDHYSILRGPRVEELAARLRDCLERAMLQAESPSIPRRST